MLVRFVIIARRLTSTDFKFFRTNACEWLFTLLTSLAMQIITNKQKLQQLMNLYRATLVDSMKKLKIMKKNL